MHDKEYGDDNSKLIEEIDNNNPDYIFITGDIVSVTDTDYEPVFELASYLGSKYNCYYITGNHEQGLSKENYNKIVSTLSNYNVEFMNDKKVSLTENVDLYGLDYGSKYYIQSPYSIEQMNDDLGKPDEDNYIILITHNPKDFNIYADWGANLIFAGHTHGGMIRIFDRGLISTDRTLFPEFDGGIYYRNGIKSQMIVSKGLSRGNKGFRLFNPPELIVVNFVESGV